MIRAVSFAKKKVFTFEGNVNAAAIALGDLDNDGSNELVIGSIDGTLAVFKHLSSQPILMSSDLGTITAVAVGDVINVGRNSIVVITAEGFCFVFNVDESSIEDLPAISPPLKQSHKLLKYALKLPVPVNIARVLIADINGDGRNELVVGRTDRFLHAYQLVSSPIPDEEAGPILLEKNKWQFGGQLGSMCSLKEDNDTFLCVAQPGGCIVSISSSGNIAHITDQVGLDTSTTTTAEVTTELINHVRSPTGDRSFIAYCTVDGQVGFHDLKQRQTKTWDIQINHQLFAVSKISMITEGTDQIALCAWDGMTFFVDADFNALLFQFPERVCAFQAGEFGVEEGKSCTCLFYVGFKDEIHVYFDINRTSIVPRDLISYAGLDSSNGNRRIIAQKIRRLLYATTN